MYKLLPRQRRRILNLLQQDNYQGDNNMRVGNPQNTLIDNHSPSVAPVLHNSCIDQMSNVHEQRSELSSVITDECSLFSIVNEQCSEFFSDVPMNDDNSKRNISPENDCNSNAEMNTFHMFQESLAEAFIQVEYLHFVGGFTLHDAIKSCMKEATTDDTILHYSAWGERGNRPLFEIKFIKAIYDAVCRNSHFNNPLRGEFFREVGEAVRFGKQRNRNVTKRMTERGIGRQRLRHEADNLLFGEKNNAHNDDAIDTDDANDGDPESN